MASSDDAAARFSSALDEVLSGGSPKLPSGVPAAPASGPPTPEPPTPEPSVEPADPEPPADWSVDDEQPVDDEPVDDEPQPVALPKIVAATAHVPATEQIPQTRPAAPVARTAPAEHTAPPVTPLPHRPIPAPAATPPAPAPAKPVTGWGDHMTSAPTAPVAANLRAPGRRPRVRKVTRVLRHIDPWSTFKVALLFSVVAYLVALTSGVLLWRVADSTGTLDNVERWFTQFGWETFELKGGEVFHNAWIIGLFGAVAMTGGLVLLATLFNLVSDIVGGVRMTVLEEEVVERTVSSTRRYVVRRPPVGGAAPGDSGPADWNVDGDDDEPPATVAPAAASTVLESDTAEHPATDWNVDDD